MQSSTGAKVINLLQRRTTSTNSLVPKSVYKDFSRERSEPDLPVSLKPTSYKAIHYERQTQLKVKHFFNLNPFYHVLPRWCSRAPKPYKPGDSFTLKFEFVLPDRRKIKRDTLVFDLISTKEYEAAQAGLMYARSLFDIFADEHYTYNGYTFKTGLQIGPSWADQEMVKTCAVLPLPVPKSPVVFPDVIAFAAKAVFSADELHHMQKVTITVYFNDCILGLIEVTTNTVFEPLDFVETFYSNPSIQKVLYARTENRNILYAFKNEDGTTRQGMMIKTSTGWNPVEITEKNDIATSVNHCGVLEFIPAVNRVNQEYPSVITIETDPGDLFTTVLGQKKSWIFNTYITEKIMNVLDAYKIVYTVKFSGNKGWHIQIPVELTEPFDIYQKVVEAIVNKDIHGLPKDIQVPAMMANLMQLEDVKSYKDPFFVARRFVDLVGAHVMFYQLRDIHTVLQLHDLKKLMVRIRPVSRGDFLKRHTDLYETSRGPVKVDIPQVLSINPYSKFRRQFKLLIDHSSNKREGKLRSVFSLHSKTGLVSIPALLHTEKGITRFDERMWDYDFVRSRAQAKYVYNQLEGVAPENGYPLLELAQKWEVNYDVTGFEQFLKDHKGLLIYLLQNGGEALELLDTPTALWVNAHLWERTKEM